MVRDTDGGGGRTKKISTRMTQRSREVGVTLVDARSKRRVKSVLTVSKPRSLQLDLPKRDLLNRNPVIGESPT